MHIILHQPEIPANTGNIGRTCVDTVLRQHLEQHKERINELYKKQREDLI